MKEKPDNFVGLDDVHETIMAESQEVRVLWDRTAKKRKFALLLAGIRKEAGLSQRDVADRAGWGKAYVSRLEGAQGGIPEIETLERFFRACGSAFGLVTGSPGAKGHFHVTHAITISGTDDMHPQVFERLEEMDLDIDTEKTPDHMLSFER
ncbi:helix-turn-helix transcriptional regulator [Fodinicurvata sp. EGI_FJ10296]|uniref:helix-turn-helix domain-containing protein n=1 Tax=Fodinicurvata sp. EGI_FJ10296 TaxID=3231908 RepID=UPI003452DA5A